MAVTTADKARIVSEHQRAKGDTGSSEVQIALLTARIAGDDALAALYWGIACHLGEPVPQNAAGDLIGHVRDSGRDYQAKVTAKTLELPGKASLENEYAKPNLRIRNWTPKLKPFIPLLSGSIISR